MIPTDPTNLRQSFVRTVVPPALPCALQQRSFGRAQAWALSCSKHVCVMFVVVSSDRAKVVDGILKDIETIKVGSHRHIVIKPLSVCQSLYGNPVARPFVKKPGTVPW